MNNVSPESQTPALVHPGSWLCNPVDNQPPGAILGLNPASLHAPRNRKPPSFCCLRLIPPCTNRVSPATHSPYSETRNTGTLRNRLNTSWSALVFWIRVD